MKLFGILLVFSVKQFHYLVELIRKNTVKFPK